jgi:ribonuclease HI
LHHHTDERVSTILAGNCGRTYNLQHMKADPHAVQISVDGSCFPLEGRRSGYAGIVIYPNDETVHEVLFQGYEESTINRMELAACIAAMEWVREQAFGRKGFGRVQIFSDSQYVVNFQSHAPFWQKNKGRNSAGRPVENWDLWRCLLSSRVRAGIRVDIAKVVNKSTPLLKRVDRLAKAAAKMPSRIDHGLVVGKLGRSKIRGSATLFPAANQVLVVHVAGSKTAGKSRENRFVLEVFDEQSKQYIAKHIAYCAPNVGVQLHRRRGFRIRLNDNPLYPQILEVLEEVPLPKSERKKAGKSSP